MHPFSEIISQFSNLIADKVAQEVKAGLAPIAPYLRRVSTGAVIIISSLVGWIFGLIFLLITLFVYLANLSTFVVPGLITSGTCFLIAIILFSVGLNLVRKPR